MVKYLVLSLDNAVGDARRKRLNYNFQWIKASENAPSWVTDKMVHRPFHTPRFKKIQAAVWYSWYRMFKTVVDNQLDEVILLEDDCVQISPIDTSDFGDQPIWLNGSFKHPKNLSLSNQAWEQTLKVRNGINSVDDVNVRIFSNWGLYIPKWQQAKAICDAIRGAPKYRTIDAHISHLKLIKRFYFPAKFTCRDEGVSTIQTRGNQWNNICYFHYLRDK